MRLAQSGVQLQQEGAERAGAGIRLSGWGYIRVLGFRVQGFRVSSRVGLGCTKDSGVRGRSLFEAGL